MTQRRFDHIWLKHLYSVTSSVRGSTTLTFEGIFVAAVAVIGFAGVRYFNQTADCAMQRSSQLMSCDHVLGCAELETNDECDASEIPPAGQNNSNESSSSDGVVESSSSSGDSSDYSNPEDASSVDTSSSSSSSSAFTTSAGGSVSSSLGSLHSASSPSAQSSIGHGGGGKLGNPIAGGGGAF